MRFKDAGVSAIDAPDGQGRRVRTVLHLAEKNGIFAVMDLAPGTVANTDRIPSNVLVSLTGWGRFDATMPLVVSVGEFVAQFTGEDVDMEAEMEKLGERIGAHPRSILESLNGELTFWLAPGETVTIPLDLPDTPPITFPQPHSAIILGTHDDTLFQVIRGALASAPQLDTDASTESRIVMKRVEGAPLEIQFIFEQRGDNLILVNTAHSLELLEAALAGDNLASNEEFKRLAAGMPDQPDFITFSSGRLAREMSNLLEHPLLGMAATPNNSLFLEAIAQRNAEEPIGFLGARKVGDRGVQWFNQGNVSVTSGLQIMFLPTMVPLLSAIAVPNFLEAQQRSKVSRVRADMRSMATALESYYIDNNNYPAWTMEQEKSVNAGRHGVSEIPTFMARPMGSNLMTLTSPIAYIHPHHFHDVFAPDPTATFGYISSNSPPDWLIFSPGPNGRYDIDISKWQPGGLQINWDWLVDVTYDPTNGTISDGDIWRARQ